MIPITGFEMMVGSHSQNSNLNVFSVNKDVLNGWRLKTWKFVNCCVKDRDVLKFSLLIFDGNQFMYFISFFIVFPLGTIVLSGQHIRAALQSSNKV